VDADTERARALLAASLTGEWTGLSADAIEDKLRRRVREAVWRPEPPRRDFEAFATRLSAGAFAYGRPGVELTGADVKRFSQVWDTVYGELRREIGDAVIRVAAAQPDDASWIADLAVRAGADIAVHADAWVLAATWSWPLRVGITAGDPVAGDVRASFADLADVVDVDETPADDVDVLIVPDDDTRDRLAGRDVHAGLVIVQGAAVDDADEILMRFRSFGALFLPQAPESDWWHRLITELSHDAPLDVAVRRVRGAVLVSSPAALALTSVRAYAALLLGADGGSGVRRPSAPVPAQLAQILEQVPFDHESGGAHHVAQILRATGTTLPITRWLVLAGRPPDQPPEESPTAYPRIDAPDEVAAGAEFDLTIGLATEPDPALRVLAGPLPVAEEVNVTVVVDGFALIEGDLTFTVNLSGTATRSLKLRAVDDAALRAERTIGVSYTVGGALRAYAMRDVRVSGAQPARPGSVEAAPQGVVTTPPLVGVDIAPPTLVLTLQQGDDRYGLTWQWTMTSDTVQLPVATPDELRTTLDRTAQDFQADLVREGSRSNGTQLYDRLLSKGQRLAEKLPPKVIEALQAAAAATAPEPPSVLLISSEGRIPWELAVIDPPIADTGSPFLCAQVKFGRWIVGARGRPATPPNSVKPVKARGVVVGDYAGLMTWRVLPQADTETAALMAAGAQRLQAEYRPVRDAVHGDPALDVLHFATHGRFLEGAREDGLVLVDRTGANPKEVYFTPGDVEAGALPTAPFVFLNACQVGAAETILGDYAGMAAAFVRIGATAVVAPLWEVADSLAATAATDFYSAVDHGTAVGEAVRALRAKFTEQVAEDADTADFGSFLAYQYFGHPNLTLRKEA
jgi:CHAT domain-containing protein